ncbi:hypothetical protein LINPERHAP2_LOCUS28821 [Linum perenne]
MRLTPDLELITALVEGGVQRPTPSISMTVRRRSHWRTCTSSRG